MRALLVSLLLAPILSAAQAQLEPSLPDIPPDANGFEYRTLLREQKLTALADTLTDVMAAGEKNLSWLEAINEARPAGEKISLTSPDATRAFPPEAPSVYSPSIILANFAAAKAAMPEAMRTVLFGAEAFPAELPVPVAEYIEYARTLDRVYQSAARWRTLSRFVGRLTKARANDIRGYHFLSRLSYREAKLASPGALSGDEKQKIREWLTGMCFNDFWSSLNYCKRTVNAAVDGNQDLNYLYDKWKTKSASLYAGFFAIPSGAPRPEFKFQKVGGAEEFLAPFTDPQSEDVRRFLQDNIEAEWKVGPWALKLPFTNAANHASVVFLPDVTPQVNGLGGNRITMNARQPLSEYDAQHTIRHEFGHVLGFPDCYVEFFDEDQGAMVNYQIDTGNIMCSRRGKVGTQHVEELRRAYGK